MAQLPHQRWKRCSLLRNTRGQSNEVAIVLHTDEVTREYILHVCRTFVRGHQTRDGRERRTVDRSIEGVFQCLGVAKAGDLNVFGMFLFLSGKISWMRRSCKRGLAVACNGGKPCLPTEIPKRELLSSGLRRRL